jgi:hypothetical protein
MHELAELLAHPSAFLPGGAESIAGLNLMMVLVTIVLVGVAARLPFPHGRGAIVLADADRLDPAAPTGRVRRDLTRTP